MTITEALAEIVTIGKRLEKKRAFVEGYLFRQERIKDPLEKEGGSRSAIAREMQAIGDLEQRVVDLRRGIANANAATQITVGGVTRSIADWLTWRRDVAPKRKAFVNGLGQKLVAMRQEAMRKGVSIASGDATGPDDVLVNLNEQELVGEAERMEEVLGALDGQLSLKNATVTIDA